MTTEPSLFSAAKALSLENIWVTPDTSLHFTLLLSPPDPEFPQVTTDPSLFSAAKAVTVENLWVTPVSSLLPALVLTAPHLVDLDAT
ncbi:hypothetical protein, partial [Sphaerospermopsis aphanizomenoides]|uniref:hypothetical protein n=1 Tax=Sphaerospermopsis aphanizomenoides TaxID=459663 RepID=UPI001D13C8BF